GPGLAVAVHDRVQGVQPLLRLARVDVGDLVREAVDDHGSILSPIRSGCTTPPRSGAGGVTSTARVSLHRARRATIGPCPAPTPPSCTPTVPAPGTPVRAVGRGRCPTARSPAAPTRPRRTSAWRSPPPSRP